MDLGPPPGPRYAGRMRAPVLALLLSFGALVLPPAPAAAAEAPAILPASARSTRLDNGLTVVLLPLTSPGLVSVQTWMDVGSRDEVAPGTTGYAHFFEHLMFHGTPTWSAEARANRLLELGVDENAWTSEDFTCYHLLFGKDGLGEVLTLEADRFAHLSLSAEGVGRESGAVYGEFRKGRANPENRLNELLYDTAFTAHTYKHSTIGYEADIAGMKTGLNTALGFFHTYYRPDRATLVIAGDIDPDAVLAQVRAAYAGWQAPAAAVPPLPIEPVQAAPRSASLTWTEGRTDGWLAMGWKIPAFVPGDRDAAAIDIINLLLTAPIAPLHRRLVEEGQLAWELSASGTQARSPGLFSLTVALREGVEPAKVEALVQEELAALMSDGPALAARVEQARGRLRRAELLGLEAPQDWAGAIGRYAALSGGDIHAYDRHLAALSAVTSADVARVASATFVEARRSTAQIRPGGAK